MTRKQTNGPGGPITNNIFWIILLLIGLIALITATNMLVYFERGVENRPFSLNSWFSLIWKPTGSLFIILFWLSQHQTIILREPKSEFLTIWKQFTPLIKYAKREVEVTKITTKYSDSTETLGKKSHWFYLYIGSERLAYPEFQQEKLSEIMPELIMIPEIDEETNQPQSSKWWD